MKVVADENMPGLDFLGSGHDLVRLPGRAMTAEHLRDADALLVRSVTRVDARLLAGTRVGFVGSATIGTDHVDLAFLHQAGIGFAHAPGCNARAVAEYVLQAVLEWSLVHERALEELRVGVVGLGNVGGDLAHLLAAAGCRVLACDPPRQRSGGREPWPWVALSDALEADVITLHVPLTRAGADATFHMLGGRELAELGPDRLLVNTCRGAVIDNGALAARLAQGDGPTTVLDVWEGEPEIDDGLYRRVWRGTPHIAGYTLEGKLRGTARVLAALAQWRGETLAHPEVRPVAGLWPGAVESAADVLALLRARYRLEDDHRDLAAVAGNAAAFDRLRKCYRVRHEMAGLVPGGRVSERWKPLLSRLGVGC